MNKIFDFKNNKIKVIELLCLALLLYVGIHFTSGFANNLDINLYDEGMFLQNGLLFAREPFNGNFPSIYSLWYALLSFFASDAIHLFYLNFKLMTIIPALLIFIFLRKNDITIQLSLAMAWIMLVARGNVYCNPRISHFMLIGILLLVLSINQKRSWFLTFLLMGIGMLLMSVMLFGWPINHEKLYTLFTQQFAQNWLYWTQAQPMQGVINPAVVVQNIATQNFGLSDSVSEAFFANPISFLKNMFYNFQFSAQRVPLLVFPAFFPLFTWSPDFISAIKKHLFLMQYLGKIVIPSLLLLLFLARRSHPENRTFLFTHILQRFAKARSNYDDYQKYS